jgi:predicted ester cyclase
MMFAVGCLVASGPGATVTPGAAAYQSTPESAAEAMSVAATQATMTAYLDALLGGDVVLTVMDTGQEVTGKQAVVDTIIALHQQMFSAQPELTGLIVGQGTAAAELVFAGTHTAEFAGIPATGRSVRVPYAAFYDLADGKITAIRLFGFASGLVLQLTAEGTPVP